MFPTAISLEHYEILRELSKSDGGVTYKGLSRANQRNVAVRVIVSGPATSPDLAAIQHLASRACALSSPYIVRVLESFEREGAVYLIMEYAEGSLLSGALGTSKMSDWDMADFARQMCSAVDHAASLNIFHPNLNPANIIQEWDGTVKLLDYGVAADPIQRANASGSLTRALQYISPEQARREVPDRRSNLYSLGVILYEMVTGQNPFAGTEPGAVIGQIISKTPEPPNRIERKLPAALADALMKALAKPPDERYQTGAEMLNALEHCRDQQTVMPKPATSPAEPKPPLARAVTLPPERPVFTPQPIVPSAVETLVRPLTATAPVTFRAPVVPKPPVAAVRQTASPVAKPTPSVPLIQTVPPKATTPPLKPTPRSEFLIIGPRSEAPAVAPAESAPARRSVSGAKQPGASAAPSPTPSAAPAATSVAPPSPASVAAPVVAAAAAPARAVVAPAPMSPAQAPMGKKSTSVSDSGKRLVVILAAAGGLLLIILGAVLLGLYLGRARNTVQEQKPTPPPAPVEQSATVQQVAVQEQPTTPEPEPVRKKKQKEAPRLARPELPVTGTAYVSSTPEGATVEVDGQATPFVTPKALFNLSAGSHLIRISKAGFEPVSRTVQVEGGQTSSVAIALAELRATLAISSYPDGAAITINGEKTGRATPATVTLVRGHYVVVLQKDGFVPSENTMEVFSGQNYRLTPHLSPLGNAEAVKEVGKFKKLFGGGGQAEMAKVQFRSNPKGAQVTANGKVMKKQTPTELLFPSGVYEVVFTLPGYKPVRRTITVSESGNQVVDIQFERETK